MDQKTQESVDKQRDVAKKFLESGELKTAATYSYDCQVSIAPGGSLTIDFRKGGTKVAQFSAGPGLLGPYTGWGTARCNKRLEDMKGKSAGFVAQGIGILGGVVHVQIVSPPDNFIGNCSTAGTVLFGPWVGAGSGKFS